MLAPLVYTRRMELKLEPGSKSQSGVIGMHGYGAGDSKAVALAEETILLVTSSLDCGAKIKNQPARFGLNKPAIPPARTASVILKQNFLRETEHGPLLSSL